MMPPFSSGGLESMMAQLNVGEGQSDPALPSGGLQDLMSQLRERSPACPITGTSEGLYGLNTRILHPQDLAELDAMKAKVSSDSGTGTEMGFRHGVKPTQTYHSATICNNKCDSMF